MTIKQTSRGRRRVVNGFTLVEVVVALAIMALSMTVIYETLGWTLRRSQRTQEKETAWLYAESILGEFRSRSELKPGRTKLEGVSGMTAFVDVERYPVSSGVESSIKPFSITIKVTSRSVELVDLKSIELAKVIE